MSLTKYDPNKRWHPQTVRLTFMVWEYRATMNVVVGGNCFGFTILATAARIAYDKLESRPARDEYGDTVEMARIILRSPAGEDLICEDDELEGEDWLMGMIISAEIVKQAEEREDVA